MFTAELPGFYYDIARKRYFPIRGPIPGALRAPPSPSSAVSHEVNQSHLAGKRKRKSSYLLDFRELHGGFVTARKFRCNFKQEYRNLQASRPIVWGYRGIHSFADSTLERLPATVQTSSGLRETTLLATGSMKGYVCFYEAGGVGQIFGFGPQQISEVVWPSDSAFRLRQRTQLANVWASTFTTCPVNVTCIKRIGRHLTESVDRLSSQRALMTTLGSGISGGSVYMLNLSEPLDTSTQDIEGRISKVASLGHAIWTASCSTNSTYAALGTDLGGALINLETGNLSWIHRSKSSIFSQHFDQSGNIVLCGFRNGSIIPVDVRQKRSGCSDLSAIPNSTAPQLTPRAPRSRHSKTSDKQCVECKKNSSTTSMSSAVCSLVGLRTDDQYFFGSSMDGNIKLFDLRLLHRGAVQSYEGHVNSHSHLQLGVDPSESLLMSGGEDCRLRIWSIKTAELVFAEKVSNSVLSAICWDHVASEDHNFAAWLGAWEGLYYISGF